ncbi:hypothetical protein AMTR_s00045p00159520 [Amborella trichopoda]|uniref:Uncharacterized protein n=1 Tax=Amborella trichopoda TaxID=13333 RepID=W1P375_AMBTC|nr:hypothetical protein AMTR_s00045p00159520 [Amborella trichopoda]
MAKEKRNSMKGCLKNNDSSIRRGRRMSFYKALEGIRKKGEKKKHVLEFPENNGFFTCEDVVL